jgi:type IV pilus assembly protein PilE
MPLAAAACRSSSSGDHLSARFASRASGTYHALTSGKGALAMKCQSGMTLIEILVAIAIVAIVAAIAVPNYQEYVKRGQITEAHSNLASQKVRMEQYYQDNRVYTGACTAGTVAPPLTNSTLFTYTCAINPQSYVLTATGVGAAAGFVFTLDQNNNRATTAVPAGWTANAACWVRRKGGKC